MQEIRVARRSIVAALLVMGLTASGAIPVALYPVTGKADERELAEAQRMVLEALKGSEPRGRFRLRKPLLLPSSCPTPVSPACVAKLAPQGGAVVFAAVKPKGSSVQVTLWLVREDGTLSRAARFDYDEFHDLRPAYNAIELLEEQAEVPAATAQPSALISSSEPPPAPAPVLDTPRPSEPPPQPVALTPAPEPAPEEGAALTYKTGPEDEEVHPGAWMRTPGMYATIGGGSAVVVGAVFGLLARGINDDLTRRFAAGQLQPSDRGNYDRLKVFSIAANTLMIGGAVAAGTGATLWYLSLTPSGPSASFSGRF